MDAFTIQPARAADLAALVALEQQSFPSDRMSPRQFRYHLKNPKAIMLVARAGKAGRPAGYVLTLYRGKARPRVYSVAVGRVFQGRGVGRKLMLAACAAARKKGAGGIVLEVRAKQKAAIGLYRSIGFRVTADLPAYYQDGADGLKMLKEF